MLFLGLISVYRNVFLVFCPRILFYYDISVTLFCGQKSFSSRPRNVILRHHNYIIFVVSLYVRAKMKKLTFELFVASSLCTWGRSQRSSPSSCSLPSSLRTWGQSCRRPSPCSSPPWAPPCSSQHDSGVQVKRGEFRGLLLWAWSLAGVRARRSPRTAPGDPDKPEEFLCNNLYQMLIFEPQV